MKKKLLFACIALAFATAIPTQALDLKGILNKSSKSDDNSNSKSNAIEDLIGNLTTTDKFDISKLVGTWEYSGPAVAFQSENVLKKVGGSAASTAIEEKLAPYYQTAGLSELNFVVAEDYSFSMTMKHGTLKGTIEKDDEGELIFNFSAFDKIKIGKVATYATLSGSTLSLTFDVSEVLKALDKVASISGNSTLEGVSSLLNSYDGLTAGFKLIKE